MFNPQADPAFNSTVFQFVFKAMTKFIGFSLAFFSFSFLSLVTLPYGIEWAPAAQAQTTDLEVNCQNSTADGEFDAGADCVFAGSGTTTSSQPLFSVPAIAPGETVSRDLIINNLDDNESCDLQMVVAEQASTDPDLAQVLDLAIYTGSSDVFGTHASGQATRGQADSMTLSDLYNTASTPYLLETLPANSSRTYHWLLTLDGPSVGNDYQGKSTEFDLSLGFTCGEPSDDDGGDTDGDGGSDDDDGASDPAEAPTCETPDMFSQPSSFNASPTPNSVALSWGSPDTGASGVSYYAIFFYDDAGHEYSVLGSGIGTDTSYTITNLSPGTWTFELIAVGGNQDLCTSPRASTSATIGGGAVTGPPQGQGGGEIVEGEVLGEQDQEGQQAQGEAALAGEGEEGQEGQPAVKGASVSCQQWRLYIPWILLLAQAGLIIVVDIKLREDRKLTKHFVALGATVASIVIFYLVRDCQCYTAQTILAWLCRWYWVASLGLTAFTRLTNYAFIEVVERSE